MKQCRKHLFLESKEGKIIRTFLWDGNPAFVVRSLETGRLELLAESVKKVQKDKVCYEVLMSIPKTIPKKGLQVSCIGILKQGQPALHLKTNLDIHHYPFSDKHIYVQGFLIALFMVSLLSLILQSSRPEESDLFKKKMKARIVKIRKNIEEKSVPIKKEMEYSSNQTKKKVEDSKQQKTVKKDVEKDITNVGALGILGAMKDDTQTLQLDLSSARESLYGEKNKSVEKPGVQKDLYAKGIFSVPAVSGGDIEGGGNYGTKGKGGGKSNYGKLNLIGSTRKRTSLFVGQSDMNTGQGGLSAEQAIALENFISRKEGLLRRCYEDRLRVFPEFKGSIFLNWTVDSSYKAKNIQIERMTMNKSSSIDLEEFKKCILDYLNSWIFPPILKEEKLDYVFTFSRSSF